MIAPLGSRLLLSGAYRINTANAVSFALAACFALFYLRMILSENRFPLFGIMRYEPVKAGLRFSMKALRPSL